MYREGYIANNMATWVSKHSVGQVDYRFVNGVDFAHAQNKLDLKNEKFKIKIGILNRNE